MVRMLLFLRHGKSDWHAGVGQDHERPVNERGVEAARFMGRFLRRAEAEPDLVITSSAVRAQTTARLAAEAGGWRCPTRATSSLYEATVGQVLQEAAGADDGVVRQLLVGHQPTWSATVSRLIGGGQVRLPTAGLACVRLDLDGWQDLGHARGELAWLVVPKLLQRAEADG